MSVFRIFEAQGRYYFWCPGCDTPHVYTIKPWQRFNEQTKKYEPGPVWQMTGPLEKASFTPSYVCGGDSSRCHFYVREGRIQFLADCHHKLAGKTVDLIDWPSEEEDAVAEDPLD